MIINEKLVTLKSGVEVTLKSPRVADAENFLAHLTTTHTESYKNLNFKPEYWKNFPVEDERKIIGDFETSESKFLINAFYDGKVVGGLGFVGAQPEFMRHNATIGISVVKAFANSGLGTAMMNYALAEGKKLGFHRVDLTVRTYNEAGIALYEKLGFERIGRLKHMALIDGQYVDEYAYQLILD
ncbi:MAG: hypothetical protein CL677_07660 [Bdellovibrionaceae bacterium]|nr:hypothetical protein [Pseudobdellovibrionaceae bacterium]|tara:strand:+ start:40357 stop:40908 length:552 start_codon:yes stop_codon:yes gene_type:complete